MKPVCQQCGHELLPFGEPDADGMQRMICPASPICPDPATRVWVGSPGAAAADRTSLWDVDRTVDPAGPRLTETEAGWRTRDEADSSTAPRPPAEAYHRAGRQSMVDVHLDSSDWTISASYARRLARALMDAADEAEEHNRSPTLRRVEPNNHDTE